MLSVTTGTFKILWLIVLHQISISNKPERKPGASLIHSGSHILGTAIGKSMTQPKLSHIANNC